MPTEIPLPASSGRTLLYDGLAQNDVDMANHRLLNLDTSNLPPIGIPPSITPPQNQWLHGWNSITQTWQISRPTFVDIGPDNGTLTPAQQSRITQVGAIRVGTWEATPLAPSEVPRLDLILSPQGNVNLNFKRIINVADPIDVQDAVNKRFMDSLLLGLNPKQAVRLASPGAGRPIPAPSGLDIPIDGKDVEDGDRILLYQFSPESHEFNEGIWIAHDGPWERAPDTLGDGGLDRAYCTVLEGDLNAGKAFVQVIVQAHNPPTVGDLQNWILFAANQGGGGGGGTITPGTGLSLSGSTLNVGGTLGRIITNPDTVDIDPAYVGQDSITTLGVIASGTWRADIIDGARGGTGYANVGKQIQLIGNLITAFSLDAPDITHDAELGFLLAGDTHLILPTSGRVATEGGVQNFTNKSITRRVSKIASNAQPSINTDTLDVFCITNLSASITSMTSNLTGTPTDRQQLEIWIKDSGSGGIKTIAWGLKWTASSDLPLPTIATSAVWLFLKFVYVSELSKWVMVQKLDKIS